MEIILTFVLYLLTNSSRMNKEYIYCAIRAAVSAGAGIMEIYNDPNSDFGIERKADNSPLTIADKKAHAVIASFLADTPYPVLSEEGKTIAYEERAAWQSLWIVDPLDGTKEFIKKNGEFTVNIALVTDGVPVMGVIYVPVKKELYFAEQSMGAYKLSNVTVLAPDDNLDTLMARSVCLPERNKHEEFIIVASRSHLSAETEDFVEQMKKEHENVELKSSGSSIKICLVAEGSADVYPRFAPTMEWDTAAGHAIAKAAGFEIYQAGKNIPLQYNKEDLLNPWFLVEKVQTKN